MVVQFFTKPYLLCVYRVSYLMHDTNTLHKTIVMLHFYAF
jgi:hypothetical protein